MYRINDKRTSISEVQTHLQEIYNEEELYKSGVFDEKTKELVIRFQVESDLPNTGEVDMATRGKLYRSYKKSRQNENIRNFHGISSSFPIIEGSYHDDMRRINRELGIILDNYGVHHTLRAQPYFSSSTSEAVRELRKIMRLKDGSEIDEELYMRMIYELKTTAK